MSIDEQMMNQDDTQAQPQSEVQTQPQQPVQPTQPTQPKQPVQQGQPQPQSSIIHPSIWRTIGESLSGIPRSRPYVDKGTGQQVNVEEGQSYTDKGTGQIVSGPRKASASDLSMAILASAIEGAFAGTQQKGPGGAVRAFGAGGQAGMAQNNAMSQQQQDQANQDFSRHFSTVDANMRQLNNAIQLGRLDREDHQNMVDMYSGELDDYNEFQPNSVKGTQIPEQDAKNLQKYPVTDYIRIPDGIVPRTDPQTGEQVKINGVPQWDNTYTMIDKSAKTSIVGEDGKLKPWMSEGMAYGLKDVPASLANANIPPNTTVSAGTAAKIQHQIVMLDTLQSELNSFTKALKLPDIDLQKATKADPSLITAVQHFQTAAGISTQPDKQIDFMRGDPKNAPYVGKIMSLFGNDNLEKLKTDRETALKVSTQAAEAEQKLLDPKDDNDAKATIGRFGNKPTDPAQQKAVAQAQSILKQGIDQSAARVAAEEAEKQKVADAQQAAEKEFLATPEKWTDDDAKQVSTMGMVEAKKYLEAHGAKVPDNFATLYTVGHNQDDISKAFTTRLSKGTGQMDHDTALSYIRQFVNPRYNSIDYNSAKNMQKVLTDPNHSPTIAAGTASRHLDALREAAEALHNHDVQLMNKVGNYFGLKFGDADIAAFQAINERVNNEVARATAGSGTAREAEIEANRKLLNTDQSPEQIEKVIKSSYGLMADRMAELDDQWNQFFGGHIHISKDATNLMRKAGFDTPWDSPTPGMRPGEVPVFHGKELVGYTMPGKKGYRPLPAQQ